MIIPNLSMKASCRPPTLIDALLPKTRQRVLAALFVEPDKRFYATQLIAMVQSGTGSVQRELTDLAQVGLITCTRVGNQKHYQANKDSPLFHEVRGLILKTLGLADVLREALLPLSDQITQAFVFGSVAKGQGATDSDIDLMLISESLGYGELMLTLEEARHRLGRHIQPQIFTPLSFAQRKQSDTAFIQRVLAQPKIWVMGQEVSLESHSVLVKSERSRKAAQK